MTERDANGRYLKGQTGNPNGRPKKQVEQDYLGVLVSVVTPQRFRAICEKATQQAERGDDRARRWVTDYLIGKPIEKHEITGADGGAMQFDDVSKLSEHERIEQVMAILDTARERAARAAVGDAV